MDDIITELMAKTISEVFEKSLNSVWEGLIKTGKFTKKTIKQKIFLYSESYAKKYLRPYGKIKILGMSEPWDLDDIYVNVQLLDKKLIQDYNKEKVHLDFLNRGNIDKESIIDGFDAVNNYQNLTIIGYPGNGKSTFLKKIGLEALKGKKGKLKFSAIPVLIELKNFNNSKNSIKELITDKFKILKFPSSLEITKELLDMGKLIILLDGFDEVPEAHMKSAYKSIQEFYEEFDSNRFVISCRRNIYNKGFSFKNFKDIRIALFDDNQVKNFVELWFTKDEKKELIELFMKELSENSASNELAKTPVLLTLMCLMYNKKFRIPRQQNELYKEAIDVWLERWWTTKQTEDNSFLLDPYDEKLLLSEIAYFNFLEDRLFFEYDNLIIQLNNFLESKEKFKNISSDKFLKQDLLRKQGILVNRVAKQYSFSHLTFQEFFVANYIYIKSSSLGNDLIIPSIKQFGSNQKWRYVFILLSGFIQDSVAIKAFLEMLSDQLTLDKSASKFKKLFRKAFDLVKNKHSILPLQLRLIYAFYFILLYLLAKFGKPYTIVGDEIREVDYPNFGIDLAVLTDTFIVPLQRDMRFSNDHPYKLVFDEFDEVLWALKSNKACSKSISFFESVNDKDLFNLDIDSILVNLKNLLDVYPEKFKSSKDYISLTHDVSNIVLSEIGLDEMLKWKESDFKSLYEVIREYYYLYTLLLECKESSNAVISDDDWTSIEDKIFNEYNNKAVENKT